MCFRILPFDKDFRKSTLYHFPFLKYKNKDNGASGGEHFDENAMFKKVIYVDDKRSTFIWAIVNISEFKKNFCQQKFRLSSFLNTSKCVIICFSKMVFHQA
ncbi:hypothetical protein ILYODFUR_020978 [Ilyodon furcidens]|uniref:Uncharacterized protein n=1 Tax=Ilyodon furcidens TaxID=33524 RepID=A0ABV0SN17_9TELE